MTTSFSKVPAKSDQNAPNADAISPATSTLQLLGRWNTEIVSLYGKRMQEYSFIPFNLLLCTSADDLTDVQEKFSKTLMADYRAATENLRRLFDADISKAGGSEANKAYSAALLKAQEDARNILDQARAHATRLIEHAELQVTKLQAAVEPQVAEGKTKAA
ncbi:MAG: hypothetical protein WCE69_17000 [Aestuariivirga sp.]